MSRIVNYIKNNIKVLGAANFLIYALNRAMQKIWKGWWINSYIVVKQPTSGNRLLPKNRGKSITIKKISREDRYIKYFPRPDKEINNRFDNDAHCFIALKNEEFVGYLWVIFGGYMEEEDRCLMIPHPADQVAWDLDIYIDPKERLSFAFPKLWDEVNDFLDREGKKWTVSRISVFNHNSISAHKRLGATAIARVNYLSVGAVQLYIGTLFPYIHLAVTKSFYPKINVMI